MIAYILIESDPLYALTPTLTLTLTLSPSLSPSPSLPVITLPIIESTTNRSSAGTG